MKLVGLRISFFFFYTFDGRDLPKLHFHYMHPDFTVDFFLPETEAENLVKLMGHSLLTRPSY